MKIKEYVEEIKIPEGVSAKFEGSLFIVTKGKESIKRIFQDPRIMIRIENNVILLQTPVMTKKEKKVIGAFRAHMKNMLQGVQQPFMYKLKVCSGHFPMNISMSAQEFIVKNFIGEKVPRVIKIPEGVTVKIEGETISVSSSDVERAGQTAAAIELLCKRTGFDKRVFQQGIYITEKAGIPV